MYNVSGTAERVRLFHNRSVPFPGNAHRIIKGVSIRAEGPTVLANISFLDLRHNFMRRAAAVHWEDDYHFNNGIASSSEGLSFDWADPVEGNYMLDEDVVPGRGDTSIYMTDLDGTLTGAPGAKVVKRDVYYTKGLGCVPREAWNLDVCPNGTRLARGNNTKEHK